MGSVRYPNARLAKKSFLQQTSQTKICVTLESTIQNSSVAIASVSALVIGVLTAKVFVAGASAPMVVNEDIKPLIVKIGSLLSPIKLLNVFKHF